MKIRGVALRTPWVIEREENPSQEKKHKKVNEQNTAREATTYIQLQNDTQTVKSQRHRRAKGNYEHRQTCVFCFGQLPAAKHVRYHLRR